MAEAEAAKEPADGDFEASAFEQLERDFQEILQELVGDKSLEHFRNEYEKLHRALKKSHESEKHLIKKCRELNQEIVANAVKVQTALKLSQEDQATITALKKEIERAWKMVEASHEKEQRARETIQNLKSEITKLGRLVEQGAGLSINQENMVNQLVHVDVHLNTRRLVQLMQSENEHGKTTKHRAQSPHARARKDQSEEDTSKDKIAGKPSSQPVVLARTIQGLLLSGTRMVQQSMRNALSPLLVFMSAELDMTTVQKGSLLSAIAAGYFFTQVPGGALADRLGAKNVMTAALGFSALCCLVLPLCVDSMGVSGLWYIMMVMGSVQGPLFPTSTVYLSKWMPKKIEGQTDEKAWGTSMLDIGVTVGTLFVIPVVNSLAGTVGWRLTYQTIGLFSLAFVGLWQVLAAEEPSRYYLTNWSPTYYSDVLGLKPEEAKYHLMAPYIMSLITTCLNPMLVKAVGKLGWDLLTMRRVFTAAGFISAGVALAPVHQLRGYNPWISTMLFSAANVFYGLTPNGFKANYLEITEQYIGVVSGYGNTLGTVASWAGPQFVAFLLQRFESWDNVMLSLAIMNVMASVNYIRSASVKPVEKLVESKKADTKKVD